ncbi:MAG: protocatechuate 3,4-dioxygenase subunit alpha, partial [Albidovulum sp.]|nr:protocatechuate 3,4-dioxygenase subunit alpha [Albidovulum sp.]
MKETEVVQHLNRLRESASQTAGPYVHIGCVPSFAGLTGMYNGVDLGRTMVNDKTAGRRISLRGRVID